jgi:hypothetical protein
LAVTSTSYVTNGSILQLSSPLAPAAFTVQNNAYIGINTTTPAYNLSVATDYNGMTGGMVYNTNSGSSVSATFGVSNGATLQDSFRMTAYGTGFTTNGSAKNDGAEKNLIYCLEMTKISV